MIKAFTIGEKIQAGISITLMVLIYGFFLLAAFALVHDAWDAPVSPEKIIERPEFNYPQNEYEYYLRLEREARWLAQIEDDRCVLEEEEK